MWALRVEVRAWVITWRWDAQSRFEERWLDSFGLWEVGIGGLLRIRLEGIWA